MTHVMAERGYARVKPLTVRPIPIVGAPGLEPISAARFSLESEGANASPNTIMIKEGRCPCGP